MVQLLWKTVRRFLKKLKRELSYDPAIPLLGIYPDKTIVQKDACHPYVHCTLFTVAKTWKQSKGSSTNEWIKMWYIYTMEYYSSTKKNAAIWVELESIILSEVSQKDKDKYIIIFGI